jgi:hypothetical protein
MSRATTTQGSRPATVDDIHDIARSLPGVTVSQVGPTVYPTPHFDGHPSVLLRGSRVGELSRDELGGFVEAAWLSRAGPRAVAKWLKERGQG